MWLTPASLRRALALLAVATTLLACGLSRSTSTAPTLPTATTPPGVPTPTPIPCPRGDKPFGAALHRATASNSAGNYTIIDIPDLYCQPTVILRVTPNWNPPTRVGGVTGVYNNHPLGAFYISAQKRWAIFNQDVAAMPAGAAFNLAYGHEIADAPLCAHTATAASITTNHTLVSCESGADTATTRLIVTPNWNSPGSGVYVNHPLGVYHVGSNWYIFTQDKAAMPLNATFNVARGGPGFTHVATAGTITTNYTILNHPAINGKPSALLQVAPNWNPGGASGVYNNHTIGVFYISSSGRWAIFNQDKAAMPLNAAFNVSY
jgi:hypothetical protein